LRLQSAIRTVGALIDIYHPRACPDRCTTPRDPSSRATSTHFSLCKILFHFKALVWKSIIPLLPPSLQSLP